MTNCRTCGSEITFKNIDGTFHPINLDGSAHHDICRTIRNEKVKSLGNTFTDNKGNGYLDKDGKKLYMTMSSRVIRGKHYKESACDCIPWEWCQKCA